MNGEHFDLSRLSGMFRGRGTRNALAARLRCQSAPLSTRLSPERHRQHTPRATRTRTRGGGAAFGVMNSPPRTQRTSSTARRSPGSGARGRYKWMMAAYLWGEILADVCMTSFIFHCCAGEPPLVEIVSDFFEMRNFNASSCRIMSGLVKIMTRHRLVSNSRTEVIESENIEAQGKS